VPRHVVGRHRQIQLGQPVHHSTTNARIVHDRSHPVVLAFFGIDLPHRIHNVPVVVIVSAL
jgi:hypothetical protein